MREENRTIAFVREAAHGLPGSIKDVADYLLSEGTGIVNLTMAQIAARTYVSKPTLVRFAKMAGSQAGRRFVTTFSLPWNQWSRSGFARQTWT